MESTHCNLCAADDPELIGLMHDMAFNNPGEFPLVQCRQCGLIYIRERPTPEEIKQYYPSDYKPYRTAIQDEHSWLLRWARRRNIKKKRYIINNYSPAVPGRVLDVGCSTGIFLDEMQQAGWQTIGIEINTEAIDYARRRFGLKVFEGQLLNIKFHSESFDVITFWDVIEHIFNPSETLQYANHILSRDGIIIMTIPHWESLDRRLFGMEWIGFDVPRHLYVFPEKPLTDMLQKAGFTVVNTWSGLGGYYTFLASLRLWLNVHFPKYGNYLLTLLEFPGIRYLFQPIFSILDWNGIGGTQVIVARKATK